MEEDMTKHTKLDTLYGKTLRWTFTDGPMAGATYEHTFHQNGTVSFRAVEGSEHGEPTREKNAAAVKVADDMFVVSYLGAAGYTLTVVLNFQTMKMIGFASNNKEWSQQKGTFELLDSAGA
jgi:Low affinity iron permease/MoaF N-terminal domain